MKLPFLNRKEEISRLKALLNRRQGSLGVLYGRRRCGKSRLLCEALPVRRSVYYVGDERESSLQRSDLAREIARLLNGFDRVTYPDWDALFTTWYEQAHPGMVLALDEFPALVSSAKEIPSILQKLLDRHEDKRLHLVLAGSSQRMMQGYVLDRTAPLFGRAREILKISPLTSGWIQKALQLKDAGKAVEAYAVWGGIPRYWELAADCKGLEDAVQNLVLNPLGVLHEEPSSLLLDDMRDMAQAASIMSLIGQGCHRLSEIAGRLEKPATSLSRPIRRLMELGLVRREIPFGALARDSKRTLYQIADPFMRFWFRFVEPNRSSLEAKQIPRVMREAKRDFPMHVSGVWEELARLSVSRIRCFNKTWKPASRWWGPGFDRKPMEINIVAESTDGKALLLGEAKWASRLTSVSILNRLQKKAQYFPLLRNKKVFFALWLQKAAPRLTGGKAFSPGQTLHSLR